ncbi:MAG: DUF2066 domain-containing protein [Agarilytica sp.]
MTFGQADYYQGSVPVKSQQTKERRTATEDALLQVLVRMSGSLDPQYDDRILQRLSRASNYVEQFQYQALESEVLKEEGYRELLTLSFSAGAVRKILADAKMPFWSENRPNTLIWLVEDNVEFGKQLLNQSSEAPIIDSLTDAGTKRGLPIIFPVLDLEDRIALSAEDVWSVDEAKIVEASARYGADVILVGRYSQTSRGEVWSIWQFFHAGASQSYDSRVVFDDQRTNALLGEDALFPLADFLAERYAILNLGEDSGRLVVDVKGIGDYRAFRKSIDYLEGLAGVSALQVAQVDDKGLRLYLESEASIDKLMSVINLDNKLVSIVDAENTLPEWQRGPKGSVENPLQFRWTSR